MATQKSNYSKIDLVITNSMTTALQIELFNYENSQTRTYNASVNDYHPMSGGTQLIVADPNVANGKKMVTVIGDVDTYVNSVAPYAPVAASRNHVYFDETGALVYDPGYVAGAKPTGQCKVTTQTANYRQWFQNSAAFPFTISHIKVKVAAAFTGQLNESFQHVQQNVLGGSKISSFTPSTYENENQQQPNIITVPVNQMITPRTALVYRAQAGTDTPNVITLSIFFTPANTAMLALV